MPTAVITVDVEAVPDRIGDLERYQSAFVIFADRGVPVGRVVTPVVGNAVEGRLLTEAFHQTAGFSYWRRWLHRQLDWTDRPKAPPLSATVAVCTRERPDDLRRCLAALAAMPNDGQEILVVDNCPRTDATRRVVEGFPAVRYLLESRPGLDVARNRALHEASNEIVAFSDDDAVPDPGWLRGHLSNYTNPMVMAVTGLTLPFELETPAQELFERYSPFGRGFERRVFSCPPHDSRHVAPLGAGANLSVRRSILVSCGAFDEALDAGTLTRSGGDHEMFGRILQAGYRVVYDPAASSRHRHRRTMAELVDTFYGYGSGVFAFWTRRLVTERDVRAAWAALGWFVRGPVRSLFQAALHRPGSLPRGLAFAEFKGALVGPFLYFRARRRLPRALRAAARIPGQ